MTLKTTPVSPSVCQRRRASRRRVSNRRVPSRPQPPPPPAPALIETDEAPQEEEPQELTLPGIPFAFNGQTIPSASLPVLNETVRLLNDHPQISVLIEGYSDAVGSEAFNLELSRNRAEAVRAYLVERGIAAERPARRRTGRGQPARPERPR